MEKEELEEKQTKFCPKCGQENEKENKFCTSCGHALVENSAPKKRKKWKWLLSFLLLIIFVGGAIVVGGWYQQEQQKKEELAQLDKEIENLSYESSSDSEESESSEEDNEVTSEDISESEENLLAASILYAEDNPPGPLWGESLDFGAKAKATKSEKPDYYKDGGVYEYSFEAKENLGSGGWPTFVPSDDWTEMYFYTSGGIPEMDEDGNPIFNPRDSLDKVSADELANFINDNGNQEEYEDIASRMVIE